MKSRIIWLALLIALCGVVILKGAGRTTPSVRLATQTQAPRGSDDSSWQAASHIAALDDSTSPGGRHHARSVVFTSDRTRPQLGDHGHPFVNRTPLDHSPTHPIPLLI